MIDPPNPAQGGALRIFQDDDRVVCALLPSAPDPAHRKNFDTRVKNMSEKMRVWIDNDDVQASVAQSGIDGGNLHLTVDLLGANSVELRRAGKWKIDEAWRASGSMDSTGKTTYSIIAEKTFDIDPPALTFVNGKWRATLVIPLPPAAKDSQAAVKTVEEWVTWNGGDKKFQLWARFPPAKE